MKKFILLAAAFAIIFASCAENKRFKKADGTEFTAKPYGWIDKEKAIDGVDYELCTGNILLSVFMSETIIVPILLTGLELWEPVSYTEPKTETQTKSNEYE